MAAAVFLGKPCKGGQPGDMFTDAQPLTRLFARSVGWQRSSDGVNAVQHEVPIDGRMLECEGGCVAQRVVQRHAIAGMGGLQQCIRPCTVEGSQQAAFKGRFVSEHQQPATLAWAVQQQGRIMRLGCLGRQLTYCHVTAQYPALAGAGHCQCANLHRPLQAWLRPVHQVFHPAKVGSCQLAQRVLQPCFGQQCLA